MMFWSIILKLKTAWKCESEDIECRSSNQIQIQYYLFIVLFNTCRIKCFDVLLLKRDTQTALYWHIY